MVMYPDYNHSILSLISSLLRHFGVPPDHDSLPVLDDALKVDPRHVALLVFDGLGLAQLERYLEPDSFLRTHLADRISSVFPATTVSAMNSYYSGLSPLQHGWLGWSLYFKEAGRAVDIFPKVDSITKQKLPPCFTPWNMLAYVPIMDRIENARPRRTTTAYISPPGIGIPGSRSEMVAVQDLEHFFATVERRFALNPVSGDRTFTFAYWPEPDTILHKMGGEAAEVRAYIRDIDARCAALAKNADKNTLLVISADHGHKDVESYIDLAAVSGLEDCLVMPPFLEARAAMFYVKREKRKDFEDVFLRKLSRSFLLFSREEMLEKGLFGPASDAVPAHRKSDDFIADYLVVATGSHALKYYEPEHDHSRDFASHHAGMTDDEMMIPLVLYRGQS